MNKQQAMEWLSAYVPGEDLDHCPEMREALELAESDPELGEWLARRLEMDARMRSVLDEEPVPAGLEESLLKTVRQSASPARRRLTWFKWTFRVAAIIVIGMGATLYMRRNEAIIQEIQSAFTGTTPDSYTEFREGMAYYVRSVYFQLDHLTSDLSSIDSWLNKKQAPTYEALPAELARLNPLGCKELTWQGQRVTLVCFHNGQGKIVHLFILDRDRADPRQYQDIQHVAKSHDLETGGWMTASRIYLLVGSDPQVDIEFALG